MHSTWMKREIQVLTSCVGILLAIGAVMLDSATVTQAEPARLYSHLRWMALGTALAVLVALPPYPLLQRRRFAGRLWLVALVLLAAVLIPGIGEKTNNARRWFVVGGQPSELAKLALLVALADHGARYHDQMIHWRRGFLKPGVMVGLTSGLILAEPDWGTSVLVGVTGGVVLFVAGTRLRFLLPSGLAGVGLLALLLRWDSHRLERLMTFVDPEKHQQGIGWQGWHSVLSLGAGGWVGRFFGGGTHKFGFVPEQQTDFILSLIGEELGFVGTTVVVLAYLGFFGAGLRIAWRTADPFGRLLALGIAVLISLQAFINIGVATSSLPNKGIPLPFVSYGGSDLVCMLAGVGLLVNVARHAVLVPEADPLPAVRPATPAGVPTPFVDPPGSTPPPVPGLAVARWWQWRRWTWHRREPVRPTRSRPYQRAPRQLSSPRAGWAADARR